MTDYLILGGSQQEKTTLLFFFEGILHQKLDGLINLIFWIAMGCGIARFGERGLKQPKLKDFGIHPQGPQGAAPAF